MITGCPENLNGKMSVIEEEDTEVESSSSHSLQTLEENLFNLPASTSKSNKRTDKNFLLKHDGSASKKNARIASVSASNIL